LVDLDFSGENILRSFPVSIIFSKDSDTNGIAYKAVINGKKRVLRQKVWFKKKGDFI